MLVVVWINKHDILGMPVFSRMQISEFSWKFHPMNQSSRVYDQFDR
ncbi:hypothetical protein CLV59_105143 [Chitinophaga dinghuensis]|uniref:Uncharacterized protein n=1 Tax=Chitinophaga dinghuensis TaxID=1539050 RepID=A0A327VYM3_9BACT|nr:hypothetical protein CLV59_105143 [Chitinophaga dinghuensis]